VADVLALNPPCRVVHGGGRAALATLRTTDAVDNSCQALRMGVWHPHIVRKNQKVNAEQKKLEADRDLLRIQVEAEQRIASARAEAEALRLQRLEVTPLLLELRRAENERLAIGKWNGQMPTTAIGSAAMPLLTLPAIR
jgi:hypothetical protein